MTTSSLLGHVKERNVYEGEFIQAVEEVLVSLDGFLERHPKYLESRVLERLVEPDRVISFRVSWLDRDGVIQVNRGYRVQFNSAIGPYKGGLRFHPSVNASILKFLGFEQVFKNALTGLPLGGGKGGSDFDPKGKTDAEVMNFCQSFMMELYRHIGAFTDIPAGDIGVGGREIGYLFGQYKRIVNEFTGAMTGKGLEFGGSLIRTEATGYGLVYFVREVLEKNGNTLRDKRFALSGSGNVAQFAAEKVLDLGGSVHTFSDSSGSVYDADGVDRDKLKFLMELKNVRRGRIKEYADKFKNVEYHSGKRPWSLERFDVALPCATQNEIEKCDARALVDGGVSVVAEGSNMSTSPEAAALFKKNGVALAPGKATNAGGVAVSGLEMTQNSMRLSWSSEEVDEKLQCIMKTIHSQVVRCGEENGVVDYVRGANVAGFIKVADAMIAQGDV